MEKEIEMFDPLMEVDIKLGTIGEVSEDFLLVHVEGETIKIILSNEAIKELVELDQKNTVFIPVNIRTKEIVW